MKKSVLDKGDHPTPEKKDRQEVQCTDTRRGDRRTCSCKGYTYITMVGWVCRREQSRRRNDKLS